MEEHDLEDSKQGWERERANTKITGTAIAVAAGGSTQRIPSGSLGNAFQDLHLEKGKH